MTTIVYRDGVICADKKVIVDDHFHRSFRWGNKLMLSSDKTVAIAFSGMSAPLTQELVDVVVPSLHLLMACYKYSMETRLKKKKKNTPYTKSEATIRDIANCDMIKVIETIVSHFVSDNRGELTYPEKMMVFSKDMVLILTDTEHDEEMEHGRGSRLSLSKDFFLFGYRIGEQILSENYTDREDIIGSINKLKDSIDIVRVMSVSGVRYLAVGTGTKAAFTAIRNGDGALDALKYASHLDPFTAWRDEPTVIELSKMRSIKYLNRTTIINLYKD